MAPALVFLVAGGAGIAAGASVLPGAGSGGWGCCPGCMNGGPVGSDGLPLAGAAVSAPADPAPGAATAATLSGSGRDRRFDLYARPRPGEATAGPKASAPPDPATAPGVAATAAPSAVPDSPKLPGFPAPGPDGVTTLDFAGLAGFAYAQPAAGDPPLTGLPAPVRALDGRRVRVTGFMLPIRMEGGRCREFLLLRNQMACCYGVAPAPTEWIVATSAKGVAPEQDLPVAFTGTLRVGARFDQGVFTGVYALEVDDAR